MTSTNDNHEIQFSVLRNDLRKRDPKTGDEPATRADGSKYVSRLMPQSEVAAAIRKNLKIAAATERVRKLYAADQVSGGDDYANGKKQMISILPGVGAPAGTQVKGMSAEFHNCCYGFDFDENQVDIAAALSALREWPHTLMAGHSVSLVGGYGIFLGPKAKTLAEYKHNWIEIEKRLPDGLAVNSGSASKNLNRERFLAADPDLYSNSDAIPITDLPPYNPDAGKRKSTSGREKQQPPKDHPHLAAWRELLASTAPKFASGTSTYNDWLAIAMDLELVDPTGDLLKIWLTAPGRKDSYGGRGGAEDKPAAKAAAAIRTILEKHGVDCSSVKLKRRVQTVKGEDDGKEDIWYAIGRFVGKTKLSDTYHYDPELRCWWEWKDGNHWHILPSDATDIIDAVQRDKYRIAAALEQTIGRDAADQWTDKKQWSHNKARASEFYTGLRDALRRELSPLPDYLVAVKNGVLDLKTGALSQHSPAAPYRVTAVAAGAYLKDADVSAVHDRLKPAIPDAARREMFLDASAVQFGGLAGGDIKGSMLYLVGDNGGGKGNSQRYVRTTFGGLAMAGNAEALSPRMSGDINNHLATIIEKRPRMLTFAEPEKLPMPRILSITGYDELTARGPHKPEVTAQLHCGVMVTAVVAPAGDTTTGAGRRLIAIRFQGKAAKRATTATEEITQAQMDALVTDLARRAMKMWQGNVPPSLQQEAPQDSDTEETMREADAVKSFIDNLSNDDIGTPVSELLKRLQAESGDDPTVKGVRGERSFAMRIRKNERWTTEVRTWKDGKGGHKCSRLVPRTDANADEPSTAAGQ